VRQPQHFKTSYLGEKQRHRAPAPFAPKHAGVPILGLGHRCPEWRGSNSWRPPNKQNQPHAPTSRHIPKAPPPCLQALAGCPPAQKPYTGAPRLKREFWGRQAAPPSLSHSPLRCLMAISRGSRRALPLNPQRRALRALEQAPASRRYCFGSTRPQ